ncbi:MAG: hypothetical protein H6725_05650 [Sandaracinaceae bacterium]|nr:hypothetical protein [Sandaracinaceae bacterium]
MVISLYLGVAGSSRRSRAGALRRAPINSIFSSHITVFMQAMSLELLFGCSMMKRFEIDSVTFESNEVIVSGRAIDHIAIGDTWRITSCDGHSVFALIDRIVCFGRDIDAIAPTWNADVYLSPHACGSADLRVIAKGWTVG